MSQAAWLNCTKNAHLLRLEAVVGGGELREGMAGRHDVDAKDEVRMLHRRTVCVLQEGTEIEKCSGRVPLTAGNLAENPMHDES